MEKKSNFIAKVFDFIFTTIFTIISTIVYGGYIVFKSIYDVLKSIIWDSFIIEIVEIIISSFKGVMYSVKFLLFIAPDNIIQFIRRKTKENKKSKELKAELRSQSFKSVPNNVKEYFSTKFNNLQIVKSYRNRRDKNLKAIYIDRNSADAKRSADKHTYEYLARDKEGKLKKGYFMAFSKLDTHSYLIDEGYEVYEIKTNKWIDFIHGESIFSQKRMSNKYLVFWLAQLSTYVKSGVTLTESVKILAEQNKDKRYKRMFDSMIYELTMGESFSESLEKQGNVFPPLLINMIKAAEKIGDIESTLDDMSKYYDDIEKNRKAIISALTYPLLVFVFSIGVITFILIYIIPKFQNIYSTMGTEMNPYTQFVIDASAFLSQKWRILLIVIGAVITGIYLIIKNVKSIRTTFQYVAMHIPVVGNLIIYNEITIFSKTFASLNKNNVLLTEIMDVLSKVTNNEIYKEIMLDTISNLLSGEKMSNSFKDNWAIPSLAYHMIATGESTGELSTMLDKVAEYYQNEQKNMTERLKSFIEPIMIIFLAVIVGGIILCIIIPMFDMYNSIR